MTELVSLYLRSVAVGFAAAAAFTAAIMVLDVGGLGHLILGSDIGWVAVAMLVVFNGIVFSAVQFGFAVMGLAEDTGPRGGLRDGLRDHGTLIPARVEAVAAKPQQRR